MTDSRCDDIEHAAEDLKRSARRFANAWLGAETSGHLRESMRHALLAARSVIEQAEQSLAGGCQDQPSSPEKPASAADG